MQITTVGVFPNRLHITETVEDLRENGLADSEISTLYVDKDGEL